MMVPRLVKIRPARLNLLSKSKLCRADSTALCQRVGVKDSWDLAFALMERIGVAATPGRDFGNHDPGRHIRFSTASDMAQLDTAAARLQAWLEAA